MSMHSQIVTQKEVMQYCDFAAGGSQSATIALYAQYDEEGLAPRASNVKPRDSHDYATILYHTALKLGWFE
ncbi:hypothetical protein DRQ25_18300 [Candidatus Fermentibacteria bacterium]|nr:MAG: hypothetical protein DRQ25_18300 [Candidatus Fermentibacteria bacterium]